MKMMIAGGIFASVALTILSAYGASISAQSPSAPVSVPGYSVNLGKDITGNLPVNNLNGGQGTSAATSGRFSAAATTATPSGIEYSAGWVSGVNPNNALLVSNLPTAVTVTAITGRPEAAVGSAATVSVAAAPNGSPCADSTVLHSGSFNANGVPAVNQSLSLTTTTVQAGASLCLRTTGGSNWSAGSGVGAISVYVNPLGSTITNCILSGSIIGGGSAQACSQITDTAGAVWTVSGGQIYRQGVVDPVTSSVTLLLYYNNNIYQYNGTNWYEWNNAPTWPAGGPGWTVLKGDPR